LIPTRNKGIGLLLVRIKYFAKEHSIAREQFFIRWFNQIVTPQRNEIRSTKENGIEQRC
jgi:hypothetical protein